MGNRSFVREKLREQTHLHVPYEAGVYGNSPRWSNKDLDPVPVEERTWTAKDYWAYWAADMLAPPLTSTVSAVMSLGFTARQTIPIVFFGFLLCSFAVTATGRIGGKYNIPFPVIARGVFGMYGSYIAISIRAFVAALWTAILTVQGGDVIFCIIEAIWPSFATLPNHLPASANIESNRLLSLFIFWILQTVLQVMPMPKLRMLFFLKAIFVPPLFLGLLIWGAIVSHGGGQIVNGHYKLTSPYMNVAFSALSGLNSVAGLFSSIAVNMPDFGRFSKNKFGGYHQILALPIIGTLGALTPIFVTAAYQTQHGTFEWYMPTIIQAFDSRAAKFFVAAIYLLALLANQIAADTYPFSNDISGMAPRYMNIFRANLVLAVFAVVVTPWNIIKNAADLLGFLSGYSCFMGPMVGVMICDVWFVKKGKLDVHELYKSDSIYRYSYGFNWRAFVSFTAGFAPLMPGFIKAINPTISVGGAWKLYTIAWIYGCVVSITVHYIICTYISPPTQVLIAEAVLPPQTVEEEKAAHGISRSQSGSRSQSENGEIDEKANPFTSTVEVLPV